MSGRNSYTFYLTGRNDTDAAVIRIIGEHPYLMFCLPYTAPYEEFHSIKEFQRESRYRPFCEEDERKKIAVIDLQGWAGHEQEEYLEIFIKFLHDRQSFFHYEYVFKVRESDRTGLGKLDRLMRQFLRGGSAAGEDGAVSYDYASSWKRYAYEETGTGFLSMEEQDLLKICDCMDLRDSGREKTSGGIPVHYRDHKLYVLKEGHTRALGETGSKKSRTAGRGAVISAVLNGDSFIMTDPKGEISSDPKIQYLMKEQGQEVHVLDFRTFGKDGFNPLAYIADMKKEGNDSKAMDAVNRFVGMLVDSKRTVDDFWNDMGGELIKSVMLFTLQALSEKDRLQDYHLATVRNYIRQDRKELQAMAGYILKRTPSGIYDPLQSYADILANPDRTYACIVSSANALLNAFCSSEALLKMLSVNTFDSRELYRRPSALFLVIPDETKTYDAAAGHLIDILYQTLVDEFSRQYQGIRPAPCSIKIICDEAASIRINDMSSKVAAARSRQIEWTLIYQSDRQMRQAYEKDFGTICGNCKNYIFFGSSDHEILRSVSEQTGEAYRARDGRPEPLVSVGALREMKKEREFKEVLLMRDNYLCCARLPDYDSFPFLRETEPVVWKNHMEDCRINVYSSRELLNDFKEGRIALNSGGSAEAPRRISASERAGRMQKKDDGASLFDIEKELEQIFQFSQGDN